MKLLMFFACALLFFAGCKNKSEEYYSQSPREIVKNSENFYTNYREVNLNRKFIPLDSTGNKIEKLDFIKQLANGDFYSVRLKDRDAVPVYKLYAFKIEDDPKIVHINRQYSLSLYENVVNEGNQILNFKLPNLKGEQIDLEKLKGEVIVLKFWFIACHACIEEFSYVNTLVAKYPKFKFISIARDSKEAVAVFMKDRRLDYNIIPAAEKYTDQLNINTWPTHIVIDRTGKIVKYVNDANDMIETLDTL